MAKPKNKKVKDTSNLCPNCLGNGVESVMKPRDDIMECSKCHSWKNKVVLSKKDKLLNEMKELTPGERAEILKNLK